MRSAVKLPRDKPLGPRVVSMAKKPFHIEVQFLPWGAKPRQNKWEKFTAYSTLKQASSALARLQHRWESIKQHATVVPGLIPIPQFRLRDTSERTPATVLSGTFPTTN